MPKYIAFLRAINVGGRRVKMDVLRQIFEAIDGISQVETFIASGNVIFISDHPPKLLESQIQTTLKEQLGYEVETFIRTPDALIQIAQHNPFPEYDAEADSLYISFLADVPSTEAIEKLHTFNNDINKFHVHGQEVYWLCHKSISESKFSNNMLEKALRMPATLRDISTIKKMIAKYA